VLPGNLAALFLSFRRFCVPCMRWDSGFFMDGFQYGWFPIYSFFCVCEPSESEVFGPTGFEGDCPSIDEYARKTERPDQEFPLAELAVSPPSSFVDVASDGEPDWYLKVIERTKLPRPQCQKPELPRPEEPKSDGETEENTEGEDRADLADVEVSVHMSPSSDLQLFDMFRLDGNLLVIVAIASRKVVCWTQANETIEIEASALDSVRMIDSNLPQRDGQGLFVGPNDEVTLVNGLMTDVQGLVQRAHRTGLFLQLAANRYNCPFWWARASDALFLES
jgi:hypothetical protein